MVGGVSGNHGHPGAAAVVGQEQDRELEDVITHLLPMVVIYALEIQLMQEQTGAFDSVVEKPKCMGMCSSMVGQSAMMSGIMMMPRWCVGCWGTKQEKHYLHRHLEML